MRPRSNAAVPRCANSQPRLDSFVAVVAAGAAIALMAVWSNVRFASLHLVTRLHICAWVYGLSAVVGQPSVLPPLSDDLQFCPWTGRRDWSAFCPLAFR